jgi:hypothetical protein
LMQQVILHGQRSSSKTLLLHDSAVNRRADGASDTRREMDRAHNEAHRYAWAGRWRPRLLTAKSSRQLA